MTIKVAHIFQVTGIVSLFLLLACGRVPVSYSQLTHQPYVHPTSQPTVIPKPLKTVQPPSPQPVKSASVVSPSSSPSPHTQPTPEPAILEEVSGLPDLEQPSIPSPLPSTYPKRPVIFVPGFMEAIPSVFFYGIKSYLAKNGWNEAQLYYLNNGLVISKAEKHAQKLKEKIEAVLQETGADKVDIVAHSYGGIYTRYYIKHLGGADKIEHFVSISSPHKGTELAKVGPFLESARQLSPGSQFLTELNTGDLTPGNICYATIRSNPDMIIWPFDSAFLEGANNHFVGIRDHFSILYTRKTQEIIQNTLSHPCDCCRTYG